MTRGSAGLEIDDFRIVHEEIDRLPRAYRSAVVVCYLQGKSQAQAAQELDVTETTVRGRLARARKLLGRRLIVRGVAPASLLITLESLNACAEEVGRATVQTTVATALQFLNRTSAACGTASAVARALANGELSAMWFYQMKTVAAVVVAAGTLATAGILVTCLVGRSESAEERLETREGRHGRCRTDEACHRRNCPLRGCVKRQHDSLVHANVGQRRR